MASRLSGRPNFFVLIANAALLCALIPTSTVLSQRNWPGFRGDSSGTAKADLPIHWSPEKGIAWESEITGYGQSAPVVWDGIVYFTSSDGPLQEHQYVHALDLQSGKERWTRTIEASTKV